MSNKVFQNEEALNNSLVQVLKEIRTNLELSQPELEAKLGVGSEYISKIERGKIKVSLELLRKFTTVFQIKVSTILERAERKYGIN